MLPRLVRELILPLHEALLQRRTFDIWHHLEVDPFPDARRLTAIQTEGLKRLIEHAVGEIPYWRRRLSGLAPGSLSGDAGELLAAIPVLTRADIRRDRHAMRWADAPGKMLLHSSSGTTDNNLTFFWGRARQSWDRAMRYRGLARHGIWPGDRLVHLWPYYPGSGLRDLSQAQVRRLRDWLTNDTVIDLRTYPRERIDAAWPRCVAYRPELIIAYPSALLALAQRVRALTHPGLPRVPGLRRILCTGEVLFDFQRRFIAETFGVPVIEEYGSQDAGLIAHEDAAGVLRLNAEQMIVEILRDGSPAQPGELGEVVVTHFYTEMMPFIRYATGDVARQPAQPLFPPAGPGLPVFPVPEGRTSDMLATMAGALCPMRPVVETLVEHAGLGEFTIHQTTLDHVAVLVAAHAGSKPDRAVVQDVLRSFLGPQLHVEWRTGARLVPLDSGKRRFVSSPVAMQLIAHDRQSGLAQARAWPQLLEN